MKRIILSVVAVMLLSACEVVVEPYHGSGYTYHNQYGYCDERKPYHHAPEEEEYYYSYHTGAYEGVCATWLVDIRHGRYEYEDWCNWENTCGWEFIVSYANYNYSH